MAGEMLSCFISVELIQTHIEGSKDEPLYKFIQISVLIFGLLFRQEHIVSIDEPPHFNVYSHFVFLVFIARHIDVIAPTSQLVGDYMLNSARLLAKIFKIYFLCKNVPKSVILGEILSQK